MLSPVMARMQPSMRVISEEPPTIVWVPNPAYKSVPLEFYWVPDGFSLRYQFVDGKYVRFTR